MGGDKIKTVIFSDLDATFLDKDNYSTGNNGHLAAELTGKGHIVVFATSKTFKETRYFIMKCGINMPFITENGGALYIPLNFPDSAGDMPPVSDSDYKKISLGTPVEKSESILRAFAAGHSIKTDMLHKMSPAEAAELTGLPQYLAAMSIKREYDLTFSLPAVQEEIIPELQKELEKEDLVLQKGGRFWHITGKTNKAVAAKKLIETLEDKYEKIIALGDSENDYELLEYADIAVVIPDKTRGLCRVLTDRLKEPVLSELPAPDGWEQTILKLF